MESIDKEEGRRSTGGGLAGAGWDGPATEAEERGSSGGEGARRSGAFCPTPQQRVPVRRASRDEEVEAVVHLAVAEAVISTNSWG